MRMLLVMVVLFAGCEGLDLDSSNDHPLLRAKSQPKAAGMSWSLRNATEAPAVLKLATEGGAAWSFDMAPRALGSVYIECREGEGVHFEVWAPPETSNYWKAHDGVTCGHGCYICGAGNVLVDYAPAR